MTPAIHYDLPTTPWRAVSRHAIGFTAGASTPAAKRWDVQPKAIEGSSDTMVGDILDTLWLGVKGRNRWMDMPPLSVTLCTLRRRLVCSGASRVIRTKCRRSFSDTPADRVSIVVARRWQSLQACASSRALSACRAFETSRSQCLLRRLPTGVRYPQARADHYGSAWSQISSSSRLRGRRGDASRCQVHGASEAPARRNDARRARNADDDPRPVTRPAAHEVVHDLGSLEAVRRE
jgi:hypothetical protein